MVREEDFSAAWLWVNRREKTKISTFVSALLFLFFPDFLFPNCISFSNSLLWHSFLKNSTKHFLCPGSIQESVSKRYWGLAGVVMVRGQGEEKWGDAQDWEDG